MQIRVVGVEKANGWDVLSNKQQNSGNIPKTATHVYITWDKGQDMVKVTREFFLATFTHHHEIFWMGEYQPKAKPQTSEYKKTKKLYEEAVKDSAKWSERRMSLPGGSTRARVTGANAKWARAAEYRDHLANKLKALETAQ